MLVAFSARSWTTLRLVEIKANVLALVLHMSLWRTVLLALAVAFARMSPSCYSICLRLCQG